MMLGIDIAQNVLNIGVKDNLNVKSSAKPSFDKVLSNLPQKSMVAKICHKWKKLPLKPNLIMIKKF